MITKDTPIEDLIRDIPSSISYMMEKGVKCLACGEPVWGTLESIAKEKGFSDDDIHCFVKDLNSLENIGTKS